VLPVEQFFPYWYPLCCHVTSSRDFRRSCVVGFHGGRARLAGFGFFSRLVPFVVVLPVHMFFCRSCVVGFHGV
jgi:hypothetical protein